MAKRVCSSSSSSLNSSNWPNLPLDLLITILDKLFYIPDYIRFSAVCKLWNSIASNQKEKRIRLNNHQLPWLLVRDWDDNNNEPYFPMSFSFYNFIAANEIRNFKLRIPAKYYHKQSTEGHGSSHGWLFFSHYSQLVLLNPLSGAAITLPRFARYRFRGTENVILSRNPSLGLPFEVLATSREAGAYMKYGADKLWTYSERTELFGTCGFAFYKDRLLGATKNGAIVSLEVILDANSQRLIKTKIIRQRLKGVGFAEPYLAETTDGDLIMVLRICMFNVTYKIYKLKEDIINGEFECVPIVNLDGYCLFLGYKQLIAVLATDYPGCKPNLIYHGKNLTGLIRTSHNLHGIDQDVYFETRDVGKTQFYGIPFHATWIVPSMSLLI